MQNFYIEVEGHQVSRELIASLLRNYMNSVGGQCYRIHVYENNAVENLSETNNPHKPTE